MQLHDPSLHQRLIEMCDCFLETDFLVQLRQAVVFDVADPEEGAIKYLALALLHALTERAGKLTLKRQKGTISAMIEGDGQKNALPAPEPALFDEIIAVVRAILHSEGEKESSPLSLGLRNGEVELLVKMEREKDKESLRIKFPKS